MVAESAKVLHTLGASAGAVAFLIPNDHSVQMQHVGFQFHDRPFDVPFESGQRPGVMMANER